jgi:hypothetical protein
LQLKLDDAFSKRQDGQRVETSAPKRGRNFSETVERYLKTHGEFDAQGKYHGDSEYGTWRKYRGRLRRLEAFSDAQKIRTLLDVGPEELETFAARAALT